jgi:CRP/FNR family transcriptional regulator, cyclic AMP receptor protein
VGKMSLADSLGRSADVTTLEESIFLWIDRANFCSGVEGSPALACNLANVLSRRLRLANVHMLSLATLEVSRRVASQLLALARAYGENTPEGTRIPVRFTQADLAALVGASRVRVNQALGYFRIHGLISLDDERRVTVRDEAALYRRTQ